MSQRGFVVLAAVVLGSGCAVDLSTPRDARIGCTDKSECPNNLICHVGYCQAAEGLDLVPPDLVGVPAVAVDPPSAVAGRPLGRVGSSFTIDFTVSEALVSAPEVSLQLSPVVLLPCSATASLQYSCTYTASGEENSGLGGVVAFDIRLVNLAGNENVKRFAGSLELDFHPPAVAAAGVFYVAGPSNPLAVVSRATSGTTITVVVIPDEDLDVAVAPTLEATLDDTTIPFTLRTDKLTSGSATFEAVVPAGVTDGTYAPSLSWQDLAGNQAPATFDDPAIIVKTSLPSLVVQQDLVSFVRSPWGNAATETLGAFTVPAGPYYGLAPADSLSPVATVAAEAFSLVGENIAMVRLWADAAGVSFMGRAAPSADGSWPRVRLASLDVPSLYVTGIDTAGNESTPPVKLVHGEWVATPNPPSFGASPHRLLSTTAAVAPEAPAPTLTTTAGGNAAGADGHAESAHAELVWRERVPSLQAPPARSQAALAYDSARGKVVLFGGRYFDTVKGSDWWRNDLWEWDVATGRWTGPIVTDVRPAPRGEAGFVYDSSRGRVVLVGGFGPDDTGGSARPKDDVWEWDGVAGRWEGPFQPTLRPSAREGVAVAYDSVRARTTLFGGNQTSGLRQSQDLDDLWEWDGASWVGPIAPDVRPAPRFDAVATYDSARGKLVVYGGEVAGVISDELWEWDSATQSWAGPFTPAVRPSEREAHGLAYDSLHRVVVLFGGWDNVGRNDDVWTWDGATSTWSGPQLPSPVPSARGWVSLAYDSASDRLWTFGGEIGSELFDAELWSFASSAWTGPLVASSAPEARREHASVYDSLRQRLVVAGGKDQGGYFVDDVQELDTTTGSWTAALKPALRPSARSGQAMAFDAGRGRTVLFGGYSYSLDRLDDVWEWDGAAGSWTGPLTPATRPGGRIFSAMVWDDVRGTAVLVAGAGTTAVLDDVWEWDGASGTWSGPYTPTSRPSARFQHALAWDSTRKKVVLFGGQDGYVGLGDVWEWDGETKTWAGPFEPAGGPGPTIGATMEYDAALDRTIVYTANGGSDLWAWDGGTHSWSGPFRPSFLPPGRSSQTLTYDSARDRLLVHGGWSANLTVVYGDLWETSATLAASPALQLDVSYRSAQVLRQAVTGLAVRADCGGAADAGPGAALYGWTTGGLPAADGLTPAGEWLPLDPMARNDTGLGSGDPLLPAPPAARLQFVTAEPLVAQRHLVDDQRVAAFQCRPVGTSAASAAAVALDYIEVRLRYQCLPAAAFCSVAADCCSDSCSGGVCSP